MGISTQTLSRAVEVAVNQSLVRGVAVANASLSAQENIVNGTTVLARAALADNSTITLTETRLSFSDRPVIVSVEPVRPGQLQISPPGTGHTPSLNPVHRPDVTGLPNAEEPTRFEPSANLQYSGVHGDLVLPGGMARLEDVSLGAASVQASPKAPVFTAPILSTSASEGGQPSPEDAAQSYVQVVIVGSAQSIVNSAIQNEPPRGP
jgi:hypothetical protein